MVCRCHPCWPAVRQNITVGWHGRAKLTSWQSGAESKGKGFRTQPLRDPPRDQLPPARPYLPMLHLDVSPLNWPTDKVSALTSQVLLQTHFWIFLFWGPTSPAFRKLWVADGLTCMKGRISGSHISWTTFSSLSVYIGVFIIVQELKVKIWILKYCVFIVKDDVSNKR